MTTTTASNRSPLLVDVSSTSVMKVCLANSWNSWLLSWQTTLCQGCVCCYFLSLWVMNQASLKRRHPQSAEAAGAEELGQIWHTSQPMLTLTHNITSQSTEKRSQLQMVRSRRPHEHRSVWPKVLSKSWIRSFSGKETCFVSPSSARFY